MTAAEVEGVLGQQQGAWNRGDLMAFTAVYAEDATFVSPSGLTHGREEVLQRYRRRKITDAERILAAVPGVAGDKIRAKVGA